MNQNPTVDNDLQQAINDITNSTNSDPVFADPIAAPSSVPEGDTGELAESVGPFPTPEPAPVTPMPEPTPMPGPAPMPFPPHPVAAPEEPVMDLNAAITDFSLPPVESQAPVETVTETTAIEAPAAAPLESHANSNNLSIREIKTAALHDLAPLVDKLDMSPSQKFNIYRDMFENLRDYTVIELAYQAAKNITDERERAEALLYLVEVIDRM